MLKILAGMGLILLLHLIVFVVLALFGSPLFFVFLIGLGLVQLVYVLPLAWYLRRRQPELFKGVLIAAGLSLLLTLILGLGLGFMKISP
jgi:uncharacterized membrane protein